MATLNQAKKQIEELRQQKPIEPPTLQVIWPNCEGPIQTVPSGNWTGLCRLVVVYEGQENDNA